MPILLVRHAWAGHSKDWEGDDRLRPLDERGRRQAEALPAALAGFRIERLVSSPFLRCTQSFEPLAAALGLTVEERDELADYAKRKHALALIDELGDTTAALWGPASAAWNFPSSSRSGTRRAISPRS